MKKYLKLISFFFCLNLQAPIFKSINKQSSEEIEANQKTDSKTNANKAAQTKLEKTEQVIKQLLKD